MEPFSGELDYKNNSIRLIGLPGECSSDIVSRWSSVVIPSFQQMALAEELYPYKYSPDVLAHVK